MNTSAQHASPDLVERFEREALPHLSELRRTAKRLTRNPHEAEDLTQETLTKAFAAFDRFAEGTNARAWLHRIMRNTFVSGLRAGGREFGVSDFGELPNEHHGFDPTLRSVDDHTPEERLLRRARGEPVRAALRDLPARFRTVLLLVDVRGCSYAEAAAAMDVPLGTVMSRLHRGRRRLRARLGQEPADTSTMKGGRHDRSRPGGRPAVGGLPLAGQHDR